MVAGLVEAVSAPMVGLTDPDSNHSDHEDKQAGPDNVLGRADSVVGRCRGGKASERPPASGLAVLAEAAAVEPMLERSAGVRGGSPPHRLGRVGTRSPVGAGSITSAARWQTAWRARAAQVRAAVRSLSPLKRQRQRWCRWAGLTGVPGVGIRCEEAVGGLGVTVGRADSVAGRRRGGKTPERPLGFDAALLVGGSSSGRCADGEASAGGVADKV